MKTFGKPIQKLQKKYLTPVYHKVSLEQSRLVRQKDVILSAVPFQPPSLEHRSVLLFKRSSELEGLNFRICVRSGID